VGPGGCLQIILWVEVTVHKQHCVCTDEVESYTTYGGRGVRGVQGKNTPSCCKELMETYVPALVLRRKTNVASSFSKFFSAMKRSSPLTDPSSLSYVNPAREIMSSTWG